MALTRSSILWRASTEETFHGAPLAQDKSVDLVIIGGGFTGNAAALEAATRGARACVLEAGVIGHGGSGRNVGTVNAGLWLQPEAVIAQMGEKAGRHLMEVLSDGPRRVFSIIEGKASIARPSGTDRCIWPIRQPD